MSEYKEISESIEVPRNTGEDGFIAVIRRLLRLSRVQNINISGGGVVRYTRVLREDEPTRPLGVDFSTLLPSSIIRNTELQEIEEEKNAAFAVARLMRQATFDHLFPVAWVSGPDTTFWLWHEKTTGISLSHKRDEAYGIPFLYDQAIPGYDLILCTAYTRQAVMVDVRKSYKTLMPEKQHLL